MKPKHYHTDVLIIGGGGAATAATIAAHEQGAKTMLAVKGQFGVPGVRGAGATSNPLGDFWTIRTVGPKGGLFNPPAAVHADMVQVGLGMADPELCQVFVDEVPEAIKRLHGMGLKFKSKMLATMEGKESDLKTNRIVATQKAIIEQTQTAVVAQANVTDLIVTNGACGGAVGVDDEGNPFVIECGAVIIATGGVGQLFQYSFNPPGNTGDGYAMALRAGAELFNMEFMQQGLATTYPRQAMVMLYEMEDPYRLLNRHGKTFLENYLPSGLSAEEVGNLKAMHWPVSCRDAAIHLDRAIKGEVLAGRATEHDAVFLDLSNAERGFQPELFTEFMLANGVDIKRDLLQIQIHHHTSNGGIRIGPHGETKIAGLYAVGEACGWQGADRLGGTMLGGSQVFGWRAGTHAGDFVKTPSGSPAAKADVERLLAPIARASQPRGSRTVDALHRALQRKMWETLIVEKDAASLHAAREFVLAQRDLLTNDCALTGPGDVALALELRNMHDVAEVIIECAAMRKESRGSHYRADFPQRDDQNWLTNIFATHTDGRLALRRHWINESIGWRDAPGDVRIKPWG